MTDANHPRSPRGPRGNSAHSGLTELIHHERAVPQPVAGVIHAGETELDLDPTETWEIEQGTDVLCEDGDKIGEVVDILPGYLVVEQGFYDPSDIYVPIGLVARHDDVSLTLAITAEEFEQRDWSERPETGDPDDDTTET